MLCERRGGNSTDFLSCSSVLKRIFVLLERRPFDPIVCRLEASAAMSAVRIYGEAGHWDDLERWGRSLRRFIGKQSFCADPELCLLESKFIYNAMKAYGSAKRWDDLERWAE